MKRILTYLIPFLSLGMMCSCIENDLSYPVKEPVFTAFEVEGQKSVSIDKEACTIDIVLGENADASNVKVLSYAVANDAQVVGGMPEYLDLTDTVKVVLRVYKDVEWAISAVQPIERYIRCENQIGEADIDPVKKMAFVYVTESQPLESLEIMDMKLEPEGSKVISTTGFVSQGGQSVPKTEACSFPMEVQFYSLKDSGMTNMADSGVPITFVKQQADHSSLAVTSIYLSQNKAKANEELKKVDIISKK